MIRKTTLPKIFLSFLLGVIFTLTKAQTGTVTGILLDDQRNPIVGGTVQVKGTTLGTGTDTAGKFTLINVPLGPQILITNYLGYQSRTIAVTVTSGINQVPSIVLTEDALLLNETVVVGYGTQIKRDLSSSLSEVKSDVLENQPGYDFTAALQGQAAGVQITTDNGAAGSASNVRIRGTTTLANSAEPLYVIDGVPIISYDVSNVGSAGLGYNISPLSNIDPADIQSITILKDAEATAIYGSRGANGVIIVTTKQGKAGKTNVDISFVTGVSQAAHTVSLLNGPQFIQEWQAAAINDNPTNPTPLPYGITPATAANTNWMKELLRTGHYEDGNVSISGGDAKTTFYIGMGFRDDQSFLVGNAFQRSSFRANLNHDVNKYFSVGFNSSLTYTYNKYVPVAEGGGLGAAESTMLPIFPVDSANGKYWNPAINPLAKIALDKSEGHTFHTISNAYMQINPIPGLSFRNEFGIDMNNDLENFYYAPEIVGGDSGVAADRRDFYFTWNLNSTLEYKKDINSNNFIDVLVGFNPSETTEKFSYVSQTGFPVTSYTQPQQGDTILSGVAGTGRQFAFLSYFARANYKLFNRFLFGLSFRIDGSSRFAPGNQYGYFPSGSFGWVISEENFMKHQKAMSFFKLRASLGTTGNSDMSTDFAYLSAYSGGAGYGGRPGIVPVNLPVSNLTWETTLKSDLGFDFGFLHDRISGTLDLYYNNTTNVLISGAPLTPSSGFSSTTRNQGSIFNRGIELQLNTNNLGPKSPVKWKTTLNIATNQNRVTSLGNGVVQVSGTNYGNNYAVVGQPVGVWLLAQYAGIDPENGAILIDSAGHKVVANASNTVSTQKPVGRPYPIFQGGLNNVISWKGLELTVLLTFSYGNQIYDDDGKRQNGDLDMYWNQLTSSLNYWTKPGQVTNTPQLSLLPVNPNNLQAQDVNTTQYLFDASYLRLKRLVIAYYLPSKVVAKMKMRSFKIYVQGENLAVATKYPGTDPETDRSSSGAITQSVNYLNPPQARTYSFGFTMGF